MRFEMRLARIHVKQDIVVRSIFHDFRLGHVSQHEVVVGLGFPVLAAFVSAVENEGNRRAHVGIRSTEGISGADWISSKSRRFVRAPKVPLMLNASGLGQAKSRSYIDSTNPVRSNTSLSVLPQSRDREEGCT
jgi:hypothetical protein